MNLERVKKFLINCDVRHEAGEKTTLDNAGVYEKTIDVDGAR